MEGSHKETKVSIHEGDRSMVGGRRRQDHKSLGQEEEG
jgi:hypothetical protein